MEVYLDGKRAFVSAGGAGMGRATCLAMHKLGAKIYTCDINEEALDTLPDDITKYTCDVSDPDEVDRIMSEVMTDGLDFLVNNAGIAGPTAPIEDVTVDQWRQTMAVCIDSQFFFTKNVVPHFKKKQQGTIINLVSAAGILGFPNRSPYVAAKWAVTGLVKTLAMELGPDNIRVNGIVPGNVNGERMDNVISAHAKGEGLSEDYVRDLYAIGTSMQCYVDPEEIADLIVFLCSDYGKHISGQIIGVDGNTETLFPRMMEE
ncbi:SDR family oxidoreductase [Curvivirga aplysinae]|uniref:SDR family oxidoreductase n=1 Tax=Curvivirga aplysinae TaxID=2529852 RepID=UPI0012BCF373|nr:SDR family oxidoreductase [Curvivirga aplysinae]MTI09856.1 SDR family oxidoreductase [Curvivirga aplysinae]